MKNKKLIVLYFLIAGISLSYSIVSYINKKNEAMEKIVRNLKSFDTKAVSSPAETAVIPSFMPEKHEETPDIKPPETENAGVKETVNQNIEDKTFALPVGGMAITPFSSNTLVFSETTKDFRTHDGLDFEAALGENVRAVWDGTVSEINGGTSLGDTVKIDHGDGLVTVYACLGEVSVAEGDTVHKGDVLGTVGKACGSEGAKGIHLHFEAIKNGVRINPEELFSK